MEDFTDSNSLSKLQAIEPSTEDKVGSSFYPFLIHSYVSRVHLSRTSFQFRDKISATNLPAIQVLMFVCRFVLKSLSGRQNAFYQNSIKCSPIYPNNSKSLRVRIVLTGCLGRPFTPMLTTFDKGFKR